MTLGEKLQKLRKQEGLSQEALAEKVDVTRQTISKWELGQSTPDLAYLAQLSDLFHVSADYLIKDDMTEPDTPSVKQRTHCPSGKIRRGLFALLSVAVLIAVWVCLICDFFGEPGLSWSGIAIASMVAAWLLLLPILTARRNILLKTLLIFISIIPFPLLAVLALLLEKPLVFRLGTYIALACVAALWIIYGIFLRCRRRLWLGFGLALLVFIPLPIAIMGLVACLLPQAQLEFRSSIFNSAITLVLSLGCFVADYWFYRKDK